MSTDDDFSTVEVQPQAGSLEQLAHMVDVLRELERRAADAARVAEQAADALLEYKLRRIPEAMELAGVADYTLRDGTKLVVEDKVLASIPKENLRERMQAHAWLRANGHGAVIKTALEVDTRPLNDEQVDSVRFALKDHGASFQEKEAVHPSTLLSLVKELLEKGTTLPPCFKVHQFKQAKLKEPKGKT